MKCKVKDCENHTDQGVFVGFLCMPCYTFLNTGEGTYSQLYRNTVAEEREACAKVCDELVLEHPGRADLTAKQCAFAIRARGQNGL
jgi:hypothetical protein